MGPAPDADDTGGQRGCQVVWRTTTEGFPPSLRYIASPYDADVHYAKKRTTQ